MREKADTTAQLWYCSPATGLTRPQQLPILLHRTPPVVPLANIGTDSKRVPILALDYSARYLALLNEAAS
jgi:hypothetical protein